MELSSWSRSAVGQTNAGGVLSVGTRLSRGFGLLLIGQGETHARRGYVITTDPEHMSIDPDISGWRGSPKRRENTFCAFRARRRAIWARGAI